MYLTYVHSRAIIVYVRREVIALNEELKRLELYRNQQAARRALRTMRQYIVELVANADEILRHDPNNRLAQQQRGIAEQFARYYFDIDDALNGEAGE